MCMYFDELIEINNELKVIIDKKDEVIVEYKCVILC